MAARIRKRPSGLVTRMFTGQSGRDGAYRALENKAPKKYRKRLRTTNMLERLNSEVTRPEKVVRIFANERSARSRHGMLLVQTTVELLVKLRCSHPLHTLTRLYSPPYR